MLCFLTVFTKLLVFLLLSNVANTEAYQCDLNAPVCGQNVTKEVCQQRDCCYSPTPFRLANCFRSGTKLSITSKVKKNALRRKPNVGDKLPEDSLNLPASLEKLFKQLGNLSKEEALEAINRLEKYLKDKAQKEDEIDWDYSIPEAFTAFVKVEPGSLFQPIIFANGTEIQIDNRLADNRNNTMKISKAIIIEYPTLMRVFKNDAKEQERRKKYCLEDIYFEDAPILSITVFDDDWNKVSVPVTYMVKGLNMSRPIISTDVETELSCKYLNESVQKWSSTGCAMAIVHNSLMSCSCNHTTKFSMLFVVRPLKLNISSHHSKNIETLEYVMESLSFSCLLTTLGVLWLVQRRRSRSSAVSSVRSGERTVVHANLVAALACLHLIRLLSEVALQFNVFCAIVVVLSHYFMLASGMWMLIEGLLLYLNVIIRSMKNTALGMHKYWTGWGIPAIIVIVSAGIGFSQRSYIQKADTPCLTENRVKITPLLYEQCWLSIKSYMIWAATGPLILIFAINIFILAHTVIFVWRLNRKTDSMMPSDYNRDNRRYFWKTAKSILVLFPILGVPWLIGFLINIDNTQLNITFQYIHVILNGLQGLFIFILYCIVNKEARTIVLRVANNRWQQHKISVSASNTLARSTSGGSRKDRSQKGHRKSVSSQMGISEQNATGTPVTTRRPSNVRSIGSSTSQHSVYTLSMNRKQSSGSGSTSVSGCVHRIHRLASAEIPRHTSGFYLRAGNSASLPRAGKFDSYRQVVRTGSVSSLHLSGEQSLRRSESEYICKECGTGPCSHAASDVAGLQELQMPDASDAVLLGYKRTSSWDSLNTKELYQSSRWPRRMTAEEFKRFSSIPEEKRRSGINSFISGDSSEHLVLASKLSSQKVEENIEMEEIKSKDQIIEPVQETVVADIHTGLNAAIVENMVEEEEQEPAQNIDIKDKVPNTIIEDSDAEESETASIKSVDSQQTKDAETNRNSGSSDALERLREEEMQLKD